MEDSTLDSPPVGSVEDSTLDSPPLGLFNGFSVFPLTETVIDGTSEVWPSFGRPITVSAVLNKDRQGVFVELFRIYHPTTEGEKAEFFKRCYLHRLQVGLLSLPARHFLRSSSLVGI